MNYNFLIGVLLVAFAFNGNAQTPIGIWENIDDEDGKAKSHIKVYEKSGKIHGKVIKLLEEATVVVCSSCKGDKKDKPIEGMIILNDMVREGDSYKGGRILDPKSGKTYKCLIEMDGRDTLNVRGYFGAPLFGRTQVWHRVSE